MIIAEPKSLSPSCRKGGLPGQATDQTVGRTLYELYIIPGLKIKLESFKDFVSPRLKNKYIERNRDFFKVVGCFIVLHFVLNVRSQTILSMQPENVLNCCLL